MSDDLRERVAREEHELLRAEWAKIGHEVTPWDQMEEIHREHYRCRVSVAISLILEEAANEAETHMYGHQAAAAIRAIGRKD